MSDLKSQLIELKKRKVELQSRIGALVEKEISQFQSKNGIAIDSLNVCLVPDVSIGCEQVSVVAYVDIELKYDSY